MKVSTLPPRAAEASSQAAVSPEPRAGRTHAGPGVADAAAPTNAPVRADASTTSQGTPPVPSEHRAALLEAVEESNQTLAPTGHEVRVEHHEATGRFVVKVVDSEDGELVRQYPAESFLKVSERLADLRGILFAGEG